MQAVDDVWLGLLEQIIPPAPSPSTGLSETRVHHGLVVADNSTKVVSYALPYVVYSSNYGSEETRRLAGRRTRRSVFMSLMFVGESPEQVKWAQQRVRDSFADRRIEIPGHKTWPVELMASQRIRRDDDALRPDGSPLFYAVDEYDHGLTLHTFQEAGVPA